MFLYNQDSAEKKNPDTPSKQPPRKKMCIRDSVDSEESQKEMDHEDAKKKKPDGPSKQSPRKKMCIRDMPDSEESQQEAEGEAAEGEGATKKDAATTKEPSQDKPENAAKAAPAEECRDDLEETLMCIICQEIFHNCVR